MTTEVLTVPTAFGDLSELSEGLADRVDEERIILYGPTPYDEGAMVGFSVLLMDGTPALEGVGRIAAAVDGGEERAPETRFDIVFDSLQLDGRSEVVYERIVLARSSLYGSDPATGEVSLEELEAQSQAAGYEDDPAAVAVEGAADAAFPMDESDAVAEDAPAEVFASFDEGEASAEDAGAEDAGAEDAGAEDAAVDAAVDEGWAADVGDVAFSEPPPAASVPPAAASVPPAAAGDDDGYDSGYEEDAGYEDDSGSTMVADIAQIRAAGQPAPSLAPPPALPSAPPGFALQAPPGGVLTRPMAPPTWWPEATAPAQPRPSTGWFQYGDALPVPAAPPRPELDPTQRVSPAPKPGDELRAPSPPSVMPPMMVGRVEEPAETPAYMGEEAYGSEASEAEDYAEGYEAEAEPQPADAEAPAVEEDPNAYEEPESLEADAEDWAGVDVDGELGELEGAELEGDTRHAVELPEEER